MSATNTVTAVDTGQPMAAGQPGRRRWVPRFSLATATPRKRGRVAFWLAAGWLGLLVVLAIFAGVLPLKGYAAADFTHVRQLPGLRWPEFLGTDALGRSELSRIIFGARVSLAVGVVSVLVGMIVGVTLGVLAGFFRGLVEAVINIFTDTLLAIPPLVLLLSLTVVLTPSLTNLIVGLAALGTPTFTRLARANTMSIAQREFVSAATVLGATRLRILRREIVPNVILPVSAFSAEIMGVFIVAEASLSFLKLGVPPPQPSWGGMIADGYPDLAIDPWLVFVPTAVLFVTVFALKIVGDRLRARIDAREEAV
jgi:peptide/nickel transport system permease protein